MKDNISKLDYTATDFGSHYADILNWIHYEVDTAQLKKELIKYAQTLGLESVAEAVPPALLTTEAKIAYCVNHGAVLPPKSLERIKNYLEQIQERQNPSPVWETVPETSSTKAVQSYVNCYSRIDNLRARVCANKLDVRTVGIETREIVSSFAQNKLSTIKMLVEHYSQSLTEAKQDPATQSWVAPLTQVVNSLIMLSNSQQSVKKGAKTARSRLMKSTVQTRDRKGEKAASQVTLKSQDDNLGIVSVDPVNAVGSQATVLYNSKSREIEVYYAEANKTLSVKGSVLVNFDPVKSQGKKIRKPEEMLPHWCGATTIRRLEVLMESIKGKARSPKGRFNKNTLVIKIL